MALTIAITGVASGIGAETARIMKGRGHRIVGFDVVETTENIDHFIALDLSDHASIEQAVSAAPASLDGLMNNAGIPPRGENQAAILQVNFLGQRPFTHGLVPHLKPGSAIVNTASLAGVRWRDNIEQVKRLARFGSGDDMSGFVNNEKLDPTRSYFLSKEAMIAWTHAMTEGLIERNIRVNAISPGGINTKIWADFDRAFGEAIAPNIKRAGRIGTPQEVAEVAAFLLSPESHWVKGNNIMIDGGISAFAASDALGLDGLI